jgi:hypothetical protein
MKTDQFHYRVNADGMIDAMRCYLTAATADNEADLHEREASHHCPDRDEFSTLIGNVQRIQRGIKRSS